MRAMVTRCDNSRCSRVIYKGDSYFKASRKYAPLHEQDYHQFRDVLEFINKSQPKEMQLSAEQIDEEVIKAEAPDELNKFLDSIKVT